MQEESHWVSRREFLKLAGVFGMTVGASAGLGSLLGACGASNEGSTTSSAEAATTQPGQGTAGEESGTTVSAGVEKGRPVKLGFVSPLTGRLANFGVPDKYCLERWNEYAADGLVLGDGKLHTFEIILQDSQSETSRASQVAGDLINNQGIDLMMVASTPDTTVPVADQCEAFGVPCISNDTPWQAWFFGRGGDPKVGFKWTYHCFWGQEDIQELYFDMWSQFPNNKVYGALWPNDADGNAYRKAWPSRLEQEGYILADPGSFEDGLEDYTAVITVFKNAGAEICAGVLSAPDFTNFWKQCKQQSYRPKAVTIGKALQFWQTVAALGDIAYGLSTVVYWTPSFPFKSSLTGETCQEFAAEYEKRNNEQWTQPLYHYALFEMAVDALKRTKDLDDKGGIAAALATLKLETIAGPVDFTLPVEESGKHPVPNVYRTECAGGQWVKGQKYPFELKITSNKGHELIPVEQTTAPLS